MCFIPLLNTNDLRILSILSLGYVFLIAFGMCLFSRVPSLSFPLYFIVLCTIYLPFAFAYNVLIGQSETKMFIISYVISSIAIFLASVVIAVLLGLLFHALGILDCGSIVTEPQFLNNAPLDQKNKPTL